MKRITFIILFTIHYSLFTYCYSQSGIINTIAGGGTGGLGDGGQATDAQLGFPLGIALDKSGNVFICDADGRIREVSASSGIITTVAGIGYEWYSGDGGQATAAELNEPSGIVLDSAGNLYIADEWNNIIRKVNSSTGIITTVVGNGYEYGGGTGGWYSGDGGPATDAELSRPYGVCFDKIGNLYIADSYNNRIRKVDTTTGIITTIAGNGYGWWHGAGTFTGQYAGDGGQATDAELYAPHAVAADDSGNVIISDCENNAVRKVSVSTGIITTVAGIGIAGYMGNGGAATAAKLNYPYASLDKYGNIYICDADNNVIRFVNYNTGIITTIAGIRPGGFSGDGGPATAAELSPQFVMPDDSGNYYIADAGNARIRKVTKDTDTVTGTTKLLNTKEVLVYPNPADEKIIFQFNKTTNGIIEIFDIAGRSVLEQRFSQSYFSINCSDFNDGVYFYKIVGINNNVIKTDKIIVIH